MPEVPKHECPEVPEPPKNRPTVAASVVPEEVKLPAAAPVPAAVAEDAHKAWQDAIAQADDGWGPYLPILVITGGRDANGEELIPGKFCTS